MTTESNMLLDFKQTLLRIANDCSEDDVLCEHMQAQAVLERWNVNWKTAAYDTRPKYSLTDYNN